MGNPRAFLTIHRQEAGYRPVHERIDDFSEVEQTLNSGDRRTQASRCMDCGVPFCHWACPLGNKQPEWQDLLYKGRYKEAYHVLEQTDDFPFPVLLQDAKPVVEYLPGWQCDISGARKWEDLPEAARSYVEYVEKAIGCHIGFVSVGAERESLIIR